MSLYKITYLEIIIMGAMASQITSLTIVYSTVYSGADQRNIKAPRHLPLCGAFTGEFAAQMASNAENVSIWWRHRVITLIVFVFHRIRWSCCLCRTAWRYFHGLSPNYSIIWIDWVTCNLSGRRNTRNIYPTFIVANHLHFFGYRIDAGEDIATQVCNKNKLVLVFRMGFTNISVYCN